MDVITDPRDIGRKKMRDTRARVAAVQAAGHPLEASDAIEADTFARDMVLAGYFNIAQTDRPMWLAARARSRRDLLWYARNIIGQTRLSEKVHRSAASWIMDKMRRRYAFGSYRDPRGNGKTTLCTRAGSEWGCIQDPIEATARNWAMRGRESRFGITTLRTEFTDSIMGVIKADLESDLFRWTFPECLDDDPDRWGVRRGMDLRRGVLRELEDHPLFASYPPMTRHVDPTFANGSLEKGRAGAHTNGEFIDDPVNEATWDSDICISTAIHAIKQLYSVARTEGGFRIVTGNHWCPSDVCDALDTDPEITVKWEVYLRSATSCAECADGYPTDRGGMVQKDGRGRWLHVHEGETFVGLMLNEDGSTPDLAAIRASCGSYHIYAAQYENAPFEGGATLWSAGQLGVFEALSWAKDENQKPVPGLLSVESRIAYSIQGKRREFPVGACEITIGYDPAHGGEGKKASEHAITTLIRTPDDVCCLGDCFSARLEDTYDAIIELVEVIKRFKKPQLRVGIESVGYQKAIKGNLARLLASEGITWLNPDKQIIPIPRSKKEGDKDTHITEVVGPMIMGGVIYVCGSVRGTGKAILQVESHPVGRMKDILDSLTLHTFLWQRLPRAPELRIRSLILQRRRLRSRRMSGAITSYGW